MREVIISNPKNDSFGTQLLSLYETLKGAQAHEKLVFNFSKLKWACPSLILPLSAYIKETGSSYNLAGSPIKSYFDAINFPRGINSISRFEAEERKNRTYTPISILKNLLAEALHESPFLDILRGFSSYFLLLPFYFIIIPDAFGG